MAHAISLKQDEAAILGDHTLLIKFPSYSGRFKINNTVYDTSGRGDTVVSVPIDAKIVKLTSQSKKQTGYADETGVDCTIEHSTLSATLADYRKEVSLNGVLYHKTKEEHLQFDAWVARLNQMKATYVELPDKEEEYVYTIIGRLIDTGNKFINTSLAIGYKDAKGGHFVVLNNSVIKDEMRLLGEKYKLEVDTSSSSMEYYKIAKQYLFSKNGVYEPRNFFHGTTSYHSIEEATEYEKSLRKQVQACVVTKVTIASDLMVSDLVAILTKVKSDVASLDVKVKDISTHRLIIKNISDKINQLQFQQ